MTAVALTLRNLTRQALMPYPVGARTGRRAAQPPPLSGMGGCLELDPTQGQLTLYHEAGGAVPFGQPNGARVEWDVDGPRPVMRLSVLHHRVPPGEEREAADRPIPIANTEFSMDGSRLRLDLLPGYEVEIG
jgi:hypothetical protein